MLNASALTVIGCMAVHPHAEAARLDPRNSETRNFQSGVTLSQGIKGEVDLFEVYLTAARQPSARIYRPHPGLARRIPVDSSSRDHPVRRRSKGQMAA
jgi:hypothetical protein